MGRKCSFKIRKLTPDRKFGSEIMAKFINNIMLHGKKTIAEKIVYNALNKASEELKIADHISIFNTVIENVQPKRTIVKRKFGGTTYSVPKEIPTQKRVLAALKLISHSILPIVRPSRKPTSGMDQARRKQKLNSTDVLAKLFIDSYNNTGVVINAKMAIQKVADANETFAHFLR